jgi:hypothetical protein
LRRHLLDFRLQLLLVIESFSCYVVLLF